MKKTQIGRIALLRISMTACLGAKLCKQMKSRVQMINARCTNIAVSSQSATKKCEGNWQEDQSQEYRGKLLLHPCWTRLPLSDNQALEGASEFQPKYDTRHAARRNPWCLMITWCRFPTTLCGICDSFDRLSFVQYPANCLEDLLDFACFHVLHADLPTNIVRRDSNLIDDKRHKPFPHTRTPTAWQTQSWYTNKCHPTQRKMESEENAQTFTGSLQLQKSKFDERSTTLQRERLSATKKCEGNWQEDQS